MAGEQPGSNYSPPVVSFTAVTAAPSLLPHSLFQLSAAALNLMNRICPSLHVEIHLQWEQQQQQHTASHHKPRLERPPLAAGANVHSTVKAVSVNDFFFMVDARVRHLFRCQRNGLLPD